MTPTEPELFSDVPASLAAALAARAAAFPEDPWLFHRRGDLPLAGGWHWRSWAQVADQVARGMAALGDVRPGQKVAFADRLEPDSVAAALAIEAAGGRAVPSAEEDDPFDSPPVRSRLDRWTADLESLAGRREDHQELWQAARRWHSALPQDGSRPIVLASARVEPACRRVLAWALATGAAWVLEDDPEAFVPAALWTRPTHVIAPGDEAGLLALALAQKRHRRWHRLRAVGLTDDAPAEIFAAGEWPNLAVATARLPSGPPLS